MRTQVISLAAAFLLRALAGAAQTPTPPTPQTTAPGPIAPAIGSVDFGFRGTDTDVDEARYERYRDLRTGAASRFSAAKETTAYVFDATAFNVGYRDQQYAVSYDRRRTHFAFLWDSIPTNYGELTLSPWAVNGNGVLTLDRALRQEVQNRQAVGVPCAPGGPPASCSTPAQASAALSNRSIYSAGLSNFDIRSRRDTAVLALDYDVARDIAVNFGFDTVGKTGHQPWGASFAFNNANEVPLPVDHRTNDIAAGIEWTHQKGTVRFAWDGSFFSNEVKTLVWDNPIRASDFDNGRLPPNGPYDPNGYSNGNGPAQGQMALWPDSSQNVFSGMAAYRLPGRTTVNGALQLTRQRQNEALIPFTINSVISSSPDVLAAFPNLASLPRDTADASMHGLNALANLSSRPYRNVGVTLRYRYNKRDIRTPPFDATEYVRFDAVPEEIDEGFSPQFDVTRKTFDANASYSFVGWGALRGGYTRDLYDRTGRGFSDVGENVFRVSFDTVSMQWLSLRAAYEHGSRRGDGFIESDIDDEGPGGTQPGLRYYDEADRNRNRGSITLTVMPHDNVGLTFTYAGGTDDFDLPDEGCESLLTCDRFGLLSSDTHAFTVGADVSPREAVSVGAYYGYERYSAFQLSRNANPPPDASWFDATRDWNMDNHETVNTLNLYLDLLGLVPNTEIRLGVDVMHSTNAFLFGGPRIAQLDTNTTVTGNPPCPSGVSDCFIPLPDVETRWTRFTADARYAFTPKVGLGFSLWYEDENRDDFATIDANGAVAFVPATGTARVDYLGGLVTGYASRPYRGITTFVRVLYQF